MLRKLYDWTMALAARETAEKWLGVIAFIESSIFLVPADVLFIPMALSRRDRAYRYALVATIASVLGGIVGWLIGHYAFDRVARPILQFYGKLATFESWSADLTIGTIVLLLITSGLSHIPPIKIVNFLAGVAAVNMPVFILAALAARGAHYFLIAFLLRRYGEPIREFIEKRLGMIAGGGAAALILLYLLYRWLH